MPSPFYDYFSEKNSKPVLMKFSKAEKTINPKDPALFVSI